MTTTATKIALDPVEHFTGARVTRRTWRAALVLSDGTETYCAHRDGHRTTDAAAICGRRLWRRSGLPVTSAEET